MKGIKYQTYFNDGKWVICEINTDKEIAYFNESSKAQEYCEFLNLGGVFDGYTPNFFMRDGPFYNVEFNLDEIYDMDYDDVLELNPWHNLANTEFNS